MNERTKIIILYAEAKRRAKTDDLSVTHLRAQFTFDINLTSCGKKLTRE